MHRAQRGDVFQFTVALTSARYVLPAAEEQQQRGHAQCQHATAGDEFHQQQLQVLLQRAITQASAVARLGGVPPGVMEPG